MMCGRRNWYQYNLFSTNHYYIHTVTFIYNYTHFTRWKVNRHPNEFMIWETILLQLVLTYVVHAYKYTYIYRYSKWLSTSYTNLFKALSRNKAYTTWQIYTLQKHRDNVLLKRVKDRKRAKVDYSCTERWYYG